MFHASPLANVNLAWANNLVYTNIVVQRNDEVLARLGEDQVSYTDKIPPDGLWTYSVVPENGNCDRATVVVRVQEAGYPQLVIGRITGYLAVGRYDITQGNAVKRMGNAEFATTPFTEKSLRAKIAAVLEV